MSVKTSTIPEFNPPGNLSELTDANKKIWSEKFISQWMNNEITGNVEGPYQKRDPLTQFFNGTVVPYDTTQQPTGITWTAFPNQVFFFSPELNSSTVPNIYQVTVNFGGSNDLRWKIADSSRIFQDEYLEWSLSRDGNSNITTAVFTCEGPEVSSSRSALLFQPSHVSTKISIGNSTLFTSKQTRLRPLKR